MPTFRPFRARAALVLFALVLGLAPVPAPGLSIMDPFNVPGTMDAGVAVVGDGISFGTDPRHVLDVYAPQNLTSAAPVVVFIYGGAWNRGERAEYRFVGHALAARGYVTVIPDYRLVPETRYPGFLEDNARAVRWVQDNIGRFGGDPARVFLAGHSAGAYNAVTLGLDRSFLDQAGVTIPIRGVAGLAGPYSVYPFEFSELQQAFGHVDNPQATQPVNIVGPGAVPMFLATGINDMIVSPRNTEHLARRLAESGLPVVRREYEGLGHMEVVFALANVWRWRAPEVLDDMTGWLVDLGAFNPAAFGPVDLLPGEVTGSTMAPADVLPPPDAPLPAPVAGFGG